MEFIAKMPVESFWGVGPVTAAKMHNLGIYTGDDLAKLTLGELRLHFGKAGAQYYQFARGIDNRPVEAYRERKSRGVERTLDADISTPEEIEELCSELVDELLGRLEKAKFTGSVLTMKVRFADFSQITRSVSGLPRGLDRKILLENIHDILAKNDISGHAIRLLGLTVSKSGASSLSNPLQLELDFDE